MALLDLATGSLRGRSGRGGDAARADRRCGALAAAAGGNAGPIAIRFPAFGDGRGISLAVLLRERHGFKGEIRAVGYLIPDLAQFLLRSGFDTAEIADPEQARDLEGIACRASSTIIRRGYRNLLPLRRDAYAQGGRGSSTSGSRGSRACTDRIREMRRRDRGPHRRSPPASGSRIRRSCMPSPNPAPRSTCSPSTPDGCSPRCWRRSSCRSFATACASASSRRRPARSSSWSPATACSASAMSVENRKACCEIRKVRPLNRELKGAQGWISGLAARAFRRARRRPARRLGRGARADQGQSGRRLVDRRTSPPISPPTTCR